MDWWERTKRPIRIVIKFILHLYTDNRTQLLLALIASRNNLKSRCEKFYFLFVFLSIEPSSFSALTIDYIMSLKKFFCVLLAELLTIRKKVRRYAFCYEHN